MSSRPKRLKAPIGALKSSILSAENVLPRLDIFLRRTAEVLDDHLDYVCVHRLSQPIELQSESTDGQRVNGTLTSLLSGWLCTFRSRARSSRYKPPDYSRLLSLRGRVTRIAASCGHADNDDTKCERQREIESRRLTLSSVPKILISTLAFSYPLWKKRVYDIKKLNNGF